MNASQRRTAATAARMLESYAQADHVEDANAGAVGHQRHWPSCTDEFCSLRAHVIDRLRQMAADDR